MRDLRLYYYNSGNLCKFGRGKTGNRKHFYKTIEEVQNQIVWEHTKTKVNLQFVIVEYFDNYNSKIIEVI